jgi:hypothetical protein
VSNLSHWLQLTYLLSLIWRPNLSLPLTPEAAAKIAFITADTTGQFVRMTFGLSGAVAEFTRLIHVVLGPLRGDVVRSYLDDMVVDAVSWSNMLFKLRQVF